MQISPKDIAALLRTLSRTANKPHFTTAIIAAAGRGTRMQNPDGKTKQMMNLCGLPVIVHTLKAFQASSLVNEIIIVALKDEIPVYEEYRTAYGIDKLSKVIAGGETRQESILCGFEAISDKTDFVAIHDGARCLITPEAIDKVINEAFRKGAATAASKATDTIKRGNINGFITETIDRNEIWLAKTPQVFKTEVYRAAAYTAKEENFIATDDNSLAEHVGFQVKLVDCGNDNLKITTPTDLIFAEAILKSRA